MSRHQKDPLRPLTAAERLALSKELAGRAQEDPSSFVEVVYFRLLQSKLPQHDLIRRRLQSEIAPL